MGEDFVVQFIDWPAGKDWNENVLNFQKTMADIRTRIDKLKKLNDSRSDATGMTKKEFKEALYDYKGELHRAADNIEDSFEGCRETVVIRVGDRYMLITGGMSWGDPPTGVYEAFDALYEAGVI